MGSPGRSAHIAVVVLGGTGLLAPAEHTITGAIAWIHRRSGTKPSCTGGACSAWTVRMRSSSSGDSRGTAPKATALHRCGVCELHLGLNGREGDLPWLWHAQISRAALAPMASQMPALVSGVLPGEASRAPIPGGRTSHGFVPAPLHLFTPHRTPTYPLARADALPKSAYPSHCQWQGQPAATRRQKNFLLV